MSYTRRKVLKGERRILAQDRSHSMHCNAWSIYPLKHRCWKWNAVCGLWKRNRSGNTFNPQSLQVQNHFHFRILSLLYFCLGIGLIVYKILGTIKTAIQLPTPSSHWLTKFPFTFFSFSFKFFCFDFLGLLFWIYLKHSKFSFFFFPASVYI